ncbi:hypothetical protein QAD02_010449 [Eretmocerus hayati]|uniref:Uncharacterized protein n=1 Tax=Eretmocerus hayati TaxID=131215 RepID=A0ACC2NTZ6_9HYME|nr:hypothetical protein QAD02_010449 [Eretmocerus hayati]
MGTTQPTSADHEKFDIVSKITYESWCENRVDCFFEKYTDDICILELAATRIVNGMTGIAPVEIVRRNNLRPPGSTVKVIGWGHTKDDLHPRRPHIAQMYVLKNDECEAQVRSLVPNCLSDVVLTAKMFCLVSKPAVVAVHGDFGSPVLINREKTLLGMLIQRCPMYHPTDVNEHQVNLVLHLGYYSEFINSAIGTRERGSMSQ